MQPDFITSDAGQRFSLMGTTVRSVATAEQTAGTWEAIESTVAPGGGSPPHTIAGDKVFYVLEGEVTLIVAGRDHVAHQGDIGYVPAGTPHNYENRAAEPARMLVITSGREHIAFLRGLAALTAPPTTAPDAVAAHAARHGVELLVG